MNLVSNGLEAMDAGGTMTIDIIEQADQVTLVVTDDGCGMTPAGDREFVRALLHAAARRSRHRPGTLDQPSHRHRSRRDHRS